MAKADTNEEPLHESLLVSFCQMLRDLQIRSGKRIGYDLRPMSPQDEPRRQSDKEEPVRLRTELGAEFPANELANWYPETGTLEVSFFGLFGPCGALPQHYTQKMMQQVRNRDYAMRDFLDMFNHRFISFFYRAWEKHQYGVSFETASSADAEDTVTKALWALIGGRIGDKDDAGRDRLHVADSTFLFYAGHMANRRTSAEGLRLIVQHAFGLKTKISQFVGQWMYLSTNDQSRVGRAPVGMSLGNQLGRDTIAGSRVWDNQNKFRVCLGPVTWTQFQSLTPLSDRLRKIADVTRRYVGAQYDFDFLIILGARHVRGTQLGDEQSSLLGWNTWLGKWPHEHDSKDAIFQVSDFEPI